MVALGCWMVWSGSRPACLPLPFTCLPLLFICLPVLFICLPGWVLVVGFPGGLSPTSFHLSPRLGACGRVSGRLVSHFLSFVSYFFSACGFQGGLSPTSSYLSPTSFHLSPGLGACSGVSGGLSPTFSPNSLQFFPVRPLCHCWCPPISTGHVTFLFIRLPGLSLLVRPFPLAMQHFYSCVSQVCHWWCPPFSAGRVAFLFICLPGVSLLMSALFGWPCSISVHLSPRPVTGPFLLDLSATSVTAGVRP